LKIRMLISKMDLNKTKDCTRNFTQKTIDIGIDKNSTGWITVENNTNSQLYPYTGEERKNATPLRSNRFDLKEFINSIVFDPNDIQENSKLSDVVYKCFLRHGCNSLPALLNLNDADYSAILKNDGTYGKDFPEEKVPALISILKYYISKELPQTDVSIDCRFGFRLVCEWSTERKSTSSENDARYFWTWLMYYEKADGLKMVTTGHSVPQVSINDSDFYAQLKLGRHILEIGKSGKPQEIKHEGGALQLDLKRCERVLIHMNLYLWLSSTVRDTEVIKSTFANDQLNISKIESIGVERWKNKISAENDIPDSLVSSAYAAGMGMEYATPLVGGGMQVAAETLSFFQSIVHFIRLSRKKDTLVGVIPHTFQALRYPDGHFELLKLENPESKYWTNVSDWEDTFELKDKKEAHCIHVQLKMGLSTNPLCK